MKKKITFTEEKYLHFKEKWIQYQSGTGSFNEKIQTLFQNIIEDALHWFASEIIEDQHRDLKVSDNITTLNQNCELPKGMNSFLIHFNNERNKLTHRNPPVFGLEELAYFNKKTYDFIRLFQPNTLVDSFEYTNLPLDNKVSEESSINNEDRIYDESDPCYKGVYGHYEIGGVEYISIYGFKKRNGIPSVSVNNGEDSINLLNRNIKNFRAVPEIGNFNIIRVFPIEELRRYYSLN